MRSRSSRDADPASVLPDIPSHFPTAEAGRPLQPAQLRRPVPRSAARAPRAGRFRRTSPRSRSRPSVGVSTLLRFLDRAGLVHVRSRRPPTTGSASRSGNAEVRLDELVAAYATFARGGVWREPTFLLPTSKAGMPTSRTRRTRATSRQSADRVLDHRHPQRPARRARSPSAAAAISSSRSRSR